MNNSPELQIAPTYKYWWLFDDETQNVDQQMENVFYSIVMPPLTLSTPSSPKMPHRK